MGLIPVTTIDATGVHVPAFEDVLAGVIAEYQGIYGSDVVLDADTQDGQWLGILASAFNDANATVAATYNAFSPATAQGAGLSSVVKINGIARKVATYSTVDQLIVGQAGAVILNGLTSDASGNRWALPIVVTIPLSGQIIVTATCTAIGAITAAPGDVSTIATPTLGWQSVTNLADATPGAPVESDAALRARQALSTSLPSVGLLGGLQGAVANVPGVTRSKVYQNSLSFTDEDGIPGHAVAAVVDGGDAAQLAQTIYVKKGAGVNTVGNELQTVVDPQGISHTIAFYRPIEPQVSWVITLKALRGFTTAIQAQVAQAIVAWTNGLGIGGDILLGRAYLPANLYGGAGSTTFDVVSLAAGRDGMTPTPTDVPMAFNEAPLADLSRVTFVVTT